MKKQVELKRLREAEERAKRNEEEAKLERKILEQQERIRCAPQFKLAHVIKTFEGRKQFDIGQIVTKSIICLEGKSMTPLHETLFS